VAHADPESNRMCHNCAKQICNVPGIERNKAITATYSVRADLVAGCSLPVNNGDLS
jgi:hypothetical protein